MATNRLERSTTNREFSERPKQWMPPELLPEPDKQPGYVYRWIRVSMMDKADPRNLISKQREGWEPVRLEEQPQFAMLSDPNSRFKDNIEIGGLLLCKTPVEFVEQRNRHFQEQTRAQAEAVDNNLMSQSDPRMPILAPERKTKYTFGSGS